MNMTAVTCLCGFTELADETFADHIMLVFEPGDQIGHDGQAHEERAPLTCACGVTASTPTDLDTHFLYAFAPRDYIGTDGKKHGPVTEDEPAGGRS
jgi:hypothetical protein